MTSQHTTLPFHQLTHHPANTPPSHSTNWHITQPFHQLTYHPAIPPANTPPSHYTSQHTILLFHQPTHHPAIPPANTLSYHSTSWHTTMPFHQPSSHATSQHLTLSCHQLTHHPVTTPPSHSISWHTTQPPHPSTSWHMTQPFHQPPNHPAIPATDTSEVKKHCCSPCGQRCFVGWAGPRLRVWLRLGRGLHSGAGGGGAGRPWGVVGRPSRLGSVGATSGTGWTRLIGWWQTWTWEVKLGRCVQCLLPLSLLPPGHFFFLSVPWFVFLASAC